MGRMYWIVATLALGSLALGSLALGSLAVGGSALAGGGVGGEIGIGFTFAPSQQGTNPGKVFHAARASDPTTGLAPGSSTFGTRATIQPRHSHLGRHSELRTVEKLV